MICPALKTSRGQAGGRVRGNLIPCALGELNKAATVAWRGLQFRGRSRWTGRNQTSAVINSAGEFITSPSERQTGAVGNSRRNRGKAQDVLFQIKTPLK